MRLSFAFDRKVGPPHPIVPLLESELSKDSKRMAEKVAASTGVQESALEWATVEGEQADILIGNQAPAGQVLDMTSLTWNPDRREVSVKYLAQESAVAVDYTKAVAKDGG